MRDIKVAIAIRCNSFDDSTLSLSLSKKKKELYFNAMLDELFESMSSWNNVKINDEAFQRKNIYFF